jgi:hypothetical protein
MHADIDIIRKAVEAGIDLIIPHEPVFYCDAETYKDNSGGFYEDVIPVLKTLVPDGGTTEDVRLVFDFDS